MASGFGHNDRSVRPASADLPLGPILQSVPLGIAIRDEAGVLVYANEAACDAAARAAQPDGAPVFQHDAYQVVDGQGRLYHVETAVDITAHRAIQERLVQAAYFDSMTGLPNQRRIEERVTALIAAANHATTFAIAFIDIDNFKQINDYYGHGVGDGLLERIARRIVTDLRPADLLARVGGDEFVLLLMPDAAGEDCKERVQHLLDRLKQPFFIDGYEIFSSASIGIGHYPQHGRDYQELRVNADSAMYKIKSETKGAIKVYDLAMGHAAAERVKIEQRLRFAIRDRRLCCAYQPKVDLRTDHVAGVEVLLRWRDEEGMIHAPGAFLKLAIELGLMDEITLMVLDETIENIDWINEAFGPQTSVSINVAPKQAGDVAFMTDFAKRLAETGLAHRFFVELTEEAFLAKSAFQSHILPILRRLGIRVSIDDFGVGYSSLSALAEITADEIKVDRSFITEIQNRPRNQCILKVIETLGQTLGMSIIVEGVETVEELAYLKEFTTIRYAQGYYFARPLMIKQVRETRSANARTRPARILRQAAAPTRVRGAHYR